MARFSPVQPRYKVNDGYHNYVVWEEQDPMDEGGFDQEKAFPLLKPAADVLGIPCRSRKQRGWYQVRKQPQLATPSAGVVASPALSPADLPIELILNIAESMGLSRWHGEEQVTMIRHELASCARVCRHWANAVQPRLFEGVTISSHSEINELLEIRRTTFTELAQYNSGPELKDWLTNPPFSHLASRMTARYPKNGWGAYNALTITGPLPASQGPTLRTIYGRIPRSLPATESACIHNLTLQHVHFRTFLDLLRLISELSKLIYFTGSQVTWPKASEPPNVPERFTSGKRRLALLQVALDDCTAGQSWLTLLLIRKKSFSEAIGLLTRRIDDWLPEVTAFYAGDRSEHWSRSDIGACLSLSVNVASQLIVPLPCRTLVDDLPNAYAHPYCPAVCRIESLRHGGE